MNMVFLGIGIIIIKVRQFSLCNDESTALQSEFELIKHTPYLTLMVKVWDVCEDFREN